MASFVVFDSFSFHCKTFAFTYVISPNNLSFCVSGRLKLYKNVSPFKFGFMMKF